MTARGRLGEELGQHWPKFAASGRPYEHAPRVQAKVVQVFCHSQGSFGLFGKAPCSNLLPAHRTKKVSTLGTILSILHVRPLPMKRVDDDSNDDAKEASLDEEGKAPQVKRLHAESQQ